MFRSISIGIILTWLLYGCKSSVPPTSLPSTPPRPDKIQIEADNAWNRHLIDTAISLLRNGDIVLRTGRGPDSYLLSQLNQKDKTFSHCGIVQIENGYPFVYHSIGGEDNPDERLRRDSVCFFFSPLHNSGLGIVRYDFDSVELSRLANVVQGFYSKRPKFDLKFDLATDNELYCTEFVYKALCKTANDTGYVKISEHLGKRYVGVDDLSCNVHCHFVWKMGYK